MLELSSKTQAFLADGGSVVTGTGQRATAVRLAYAAAALRAGRRVWRSPDVLAWNAWLEREWGREPAAPRRVLRPAEEWLLWREVAAQAAADADPLFRDSMTRGLREAAALVAAWEIPTEALRGLPGSETLVLRRALSSFEGRCEEARVIARMHLAAPLAARAPGPSALRFAGCAPLTPSQQRFHASPAAPAERRARAYLAAAPDRERELELIAAWAHRQLSADPARRLLVVLPDLADRSAQLARALRAALAPAELLGLPPTDETPPFAIEGGQPLARYAPVAHALESLALCIEPLEFERLSAWLRAPFCSDPSATERARIDLWLRKRGRTVFDAQSLSEELNAGTPTLCPGGARLRTRLQGALDAFGRGSGSSRLWAQRFHAALAALDWPGVADLRSADAQLLARFLELLHEFGSIALGAHSLGARDALTLLRDLAAQVAFEPASGDTPVTVTGSLADPVVGYDGIWVAGLQAHAWPPAAQPNPFVPWRLQRAAGIAQASADGQLARAEQALGDWRRATFELVLSYAQHVDDAPGVASPLLTTADAAPFEAPPTAAPFAVRHRSGGAHEELLDEQGPPWSTEVPLPGTRALELQNQCPFRAFGELRLGALALEPPARGIDQRLRGQLLHAALEGLWRALGGSQELARRDASALEALIDRQVRTAARKVFAKWAIEPDSGLGEREVRRAVRLIAELCELERSRSPFSVEAVELERRLNLNGAVLNVRLDRLDALADGSLVILDYKSGRGTAQQWREEPVSHPQLLAYVLAVGDPVAAFATVHVARGGVQFRGTAARAGLLPKVRAFAAAGASDPARDWAEQVKRWQGMTQRLATDFAAGVAAVVPMAHACDRCHLHGFCRVADWPSVHAGEGEGEPGGDAAAGGSGEPGDE